MRWIYNPKNTNKRWTTHIHRLISKSTQNKYWWNLYDPRSNPNPTITTHTSLIDNFNKLTNWQIDMKIYQYVSTYNNIFNVSKYAILYYKFNAYFYLLKQQNVMWNKENQQLKLKSGWSYHWREWNHNPQIWSNCQDLTFHNNLCQIGKWRKENWNKCNTIYLWKITSIEINQTGW